MNLELFCSFPLFLLTFRTYLMHTIILRHIILWEQNPTQMERFFTQCLSLGSTLNANIGSFFHVLGKISKTTKRSSEHVKRRFDNPVENFSPKIRKFLCSKSENDKKINKLFKKKYIFLKVFFWTRRMQFWQPCLKCCKFFGKSPKIFLTNFEKN